MKCQASQGGPCSPEPLLTATKAPKSHWGCTPWLPIPAPTVASVRICTKNENHQSSSWQAVWKHPDVTVWRWGLWPSNGSRLAWVMMMWTENGQSLVSWRTWVKLGVGVISVSPARRAWAGARWEEHLPTYQNILKSGSAFFPTLKLVMDSSTISMNYFT